MLRQLDAKMDRVIDDIADLKRRVTALEEGQAALAQGLAGVNRWLDRLEARLTVEHRLDLAETSAKASPSFFRGRAGLSRHPQSVLGRSWGGLGAVLGRSWGSWGSLGALGRRSQPIVLRQTASTPGRIGANSWL